MYRVYIQYTLMGENSFVCIHKFISDLEFLVKYAVTASHEKIGMNGISLVRTKTLLGEMLMLLYAEKSVDDPSISFKICRVGRKKILLFGAKEIFFKCILLKSLVLNGFLLLCKRVSGTADWAVSHVLVMLSLRHGEMKTKDMTNCVSPPLPPYSQLAKISPHEATHSS